MVTAEEAFAEHQVQHIYVASLPLLSANMRTEQESLLLWLVQWHERPAPHSSWVFMLASLPLPLAAGLPHDSDCWSLTEHHFLFAVWFICLLSSIFKWILRMLSGISISQCRREAASSQCNMLWPSQHCHAKRAGPCPCFKNTELQRSDSATQQLCHPSCRLYSHLVQWRRTRATLDHALPKKEWKFSLSIAEGLFTPPKKWELVLSSLVHMPTNLFSQW